MRLVVRPGADRPARSAVALVPALCCALLLVLTGCSRSSPTRGATGSVASTSTPARTAAPTAGRSTYTLMQTNLCLSGLAGCYAKVDYPAAVQEAEARIRQVRPNAVTLNEACRGDAAQIARLTGYHMRFSKIIYLGQLLHCIDPAGRGLFGDAVLTAAPIERTENRDFVVQVGIERRRWLCVTTRLHVDVCTAHLATRSPEEVAGNDAQCAELAQLIARRAATRTVIFGGDMNRRGSCAPPGVWTRTDASAHQAPGLQQVYGSRALRSASAEVLPAMHTDHDVLLVHARLTTRR